MSVGSMDEKRAFFEHLYGTHEIPLIMGPPKPVRTFEHDIYEEQKALRLRSQAPTLVVCRPTVPVKPARRKKVPAADKIEDPLAPDPPDPKTKPPRPPPPMLPSKATSLHSSNNVKKTLEKAPSHQEKKPPLPPKPISPFRLRGHPRYFQLSHEYEHIAVETRIAEHLPIKRCNSDEELYAMPLKRPTAVAPPVPLHRPLPKKRVNVPQEIELHYAATDVSILTKPRSQSEPLDVVLKKPVLLERDSPNNVKRKLFKLGKSLDHGGNHQILPKIIPRRSRNGSIMTSESSDEDSIAGIDANGSQQSVDSLASDRLEDVSKRADRARVVRRRTIAFYDQQVAAFCQRKAPQLFEVALVIKLIERERASAKDIANVASPGGCHSPSLYLPVVSARYPNDNARKTAVGIADSDAASLSPDAMTPSLFYPDFFKACAIGPKDHWSGDEEFIVTLTNESGQRKFAYCVRYLPREREGGYNGQSVLPEVMVIVSPVQAPSFYLALAHEAVVYAKKSVLILLPRFLAAVFWKPFPSVPGECLVVAEIEGSLLGRRAVIKNAGTLVGRSGCAAVVAKLGVENVVCVFAALLAERRVLIAGEAVSAVARAVQTLSAFLAPLSWPHTLVPVIPDSLVDYCHSPTPFLIGILRSNLYRLKELLVDENGEEGSGDELLIADLDYGVLIPRPADLGRVNESDSWRYRSAVQLCGRLGMPRKLTSDLVRSLRLAIAAGDGQAADAKVEDAFIGWYATLLGHYREFALVQQQDGRPDFQKHSFADAHPLKSGRLFLKWFVETGIFQDWIRRKTEAARNKNGRVFLDASDERLDQLAAGSYRTDLLGVFNKLRSSFFGLF